MLERNFVAYGIALAELVQHLRNQCHPHELRNSLARAHTQTRHGDVFFADRDGALIIGEGALGGPATGADVLLDAMRLHEVRAIAVNGASTPKELLLLATLLSGTPGEGKQSVFALANELGVWNVRLTADDAPTVTETLETSAADLDTLVARVLAFMKTEGDAVPAAADNMVAVEPSIESFESIATPTALRQLVQLLPCNQERHANVLTILRRAGDEGASALFSALVAAPRLGKRRAMFDAIVELGAGIPMLIAHLSHPQWFVVRNATALLGDMRAAIAEAPLTQLLSHADERVRAAAVTALAELGTTTSARSLDCALRDKSPTVRRRALHGMRAVPDTPISAAALSDAIELERSPSMQLEFLAAMVAQQSPEVAQRLARFCSPSTSAAYTPEFRVVAIDALTRLKPGVATRFLRVLTEDRNEIVQLHAVRLLRGLGEERRAS